MYSFQNIPRQNLFQRCSKDTPVPQSGFLMRNPFNRGSNDSLTVPSGNPVPMGCESRLGMMTNGGDFFECPDGTVLQISTGKTVRKSMEQEGEKMRMIDSPFSSHDASWNDDEEEQLNKADLEYAELSRRESKRLIDNMTEEQRQLLDDLENGRIFKLSKLQEIGK